MAFTVNPIKFGTDGWRGVIAADFTFERVAMLAPLAAQVLAENYGDIAANRTVIVGYDRRFMAEDFAQVTAESLQEAGFDVLLSECFAPTPAFSWAAKAHNALGAIVLTASHKSEECVWRFGTSRNYRANRGNDRQHFTSGRKARKNNEI